MTNPPDDEVSDIPDTEEDLLRYRALVDTMNEGFGVINEENKFQYVNRRYTEMLGYSLEEMIGRKLEFFLDAKNAEILHEHIQRRSKGEASQYELEWTTKYGGKVSTIVSGAPLIDEQGRHRGSYAVVTDITDRRKLERALRESERNYRTMAEKSLQGITVIQNEEYVFVNSAFGRIVGYTVDEILSMSPEAQWHLVHPDDREYLLTLAEDRTAGRPTPSTYEYRFLRKDGTVRWVEAFSTTIVYNGKEALQVFIIDITDRRAAENKLRASEQMLKLVLDNIPAFVFWKNEELEYLGCNDSFAQSAGLSTPREIVGKTDDDLPWEEKETGFFKEVDLRVIDKDQPEYHILESLTRADGKQVWIDTSKVPLHDENGSVIGVLGIAEDITESVQTEEAIRKSEEKYRALAEQSSQGLTILTDSGFTYVNRAFSEMTGHSIDELLDMSLQEVWSLIHEDDRPMLRARIEARRTGAPMPPRTQYRLVTKSNEIKFVEVFTSTIDYEDELAVQTILVDVTEKLQAEKEVRTAKERATLYLDLMSHDIRNQLQVILSTAGLLRNAVDESLKDSFLEVVKNAVQRCSRMIEEVRATEHLLAVPLEERDLKNALQGCIDVLSDRISGVVFETSLEIDIAPVHADQFLELLLMNILTNAIEHNKSSDRRIWVKLEEETNEYLIVVADNGPGIPDSAKTGLFDMARRFGGLGLHQSNQIVEKYGGRIKILDRIQGQHWEGAEFHIWLPKVKN